MAAAQVSPMPDDSAMNDACAAERPVDRVLSERPPGYYQEYLFSVVGQTADIPEEDKRYLTEHPDKSERWRPYIPGEVEVEPSEVTDGYVFEHRYFDGTRTGVWNRQLLRRADWPRWDPRSRKHT